MQIKKKMTRIGILIPTRGDRPAFMQNCLRMIENQTLQPTEIEVIDDAPNNDEVDISWRYRIGYERLSKKNIDLIAFMEDDDWYHPAYLEVMAMQWEQNGRPLLLGHTYTIYYHLKLKRYFFFNHSTRSSAMNTCMRPNIPNIPWPVDIDPYTDIHLWTKVGENASDRVVFKPHQHICIGMKHAQGKTGGFFHDKEMDRWNLPDTFADNGFLESVIAPVDPIGYDFYKNLVL